MPAVNCLSVQKCSNSSSKFFIWNEFGGDLEGPLLISCRKCFTTKSFQIRSNLPFSASRWIFWRKLKARFAFRDSLSLATVQQLPGILDFGSYAESLGYSPASTENSTVRSEELTRHSVSLGGIVFANYVTRLYSGCLTEHLLVSTEYLLLQLSTRFVLGSSHRALGVTW